MKHLLVQICSIRRDLSLLFFLFLSVPTMSTICESESNKLPALLSLMMTPSPLFAFTSFIFALLFGIPIDGLAELADVFCDNASVTTSNASVPTSVLAKKHNSICYHRVREAQASGAQRVAWISGEYYNQADLLTKTSLPTDSRKTGICHEIFGWRRKDIYPYEKDTG